MFDYKTMTTPDGEHVSYATMPMYMINTIMLDDRLTHSACKIFMRLMAYASSVNSCQFKITNKWVEENTALSERTVIRALDQLRTLGYIDANGIVYGKPPANQLRATATPARTSVAQRKVQTTPVSVQITQAINTPVPSVQVNHFTDATKLVDETDINADINEQANAMLASLGIRKKVTISGTKTPDILPNQAVKNDTQTAKVAAPIITIPNNTLLKNTPTASAEKVAAKKPTQPTEQSGLLFSASQKGFVEKSQPKPLASFIPTLGKGQTVAIGKPSTALSPQHTSYIATALQRMKVTSPQERKRYTDEIAYAATQGRLPKPTAIHRLKPSALA